MSSDARAKAEEALAEARKAVNRWVVDDRRVPKADLVGYLVLLADLTEPLLSAPPPRPAQDAVREAAETLEPIDTIKVACGTADKADVAQRIGRARVALDAALRANASPAPGSAEVREAAEALLDDYAGVEDMLLPDTLEKVLRLRAALRGGQEGEGR